MDFFPPRWGICRAEKRVHTCVKAFPRPGGEAVVLPSCTPHVGLGGAGQKLQSRGERGGEGGAGQAGGGGGAEEGGKGGLANGRGERKEEVGVSRAGGRWPPDTETRVSRQ